MLIALLFYAIPGKPVLRLTEFAIHDLPQTVVFEMQETGGLARIDFESDVSNSWAYVEIEVVDPTGEALFEAGDVIEYYYGVEGGERWSEGSTRTFRQGTGYFGWLGLSLSLVFGTGCLARFTTCAVGVTATGATTDMSPTRVAFLVLSCVAILGTSYVGYYGIASESASVDRSTRTGSGGNSSGTGRIK